MSRPIGARGLKPAVYVRRAAHGVVAPHRGAWVETEQRDELAGFLNVAPHRGAWVETPMRLRARYSSRCRAP